MLHPLKLKRLEQGLSQHALSFISGIPQFRICYAEKWYPAFNDRRKKSLAKIFKCSPEEFFPSTNNGVIIEGREKDLQDRSSFRSLN